MTDDISQSEIRRTLDRLEKTVEKIDGKLEDLPNFRDVEVRLAPLEQSISDLQDNQRWLTRTAMGALVLAILDPLFRVLSG